MSPEAQVVFVRGYIAGLSRGFEEGCDADRTIDPRKNYDLHDDRFAKCLNRSPGFSKPVEYYAKQVAAFYASFPSDRTVPFETVVKKLSDSESMTTQQMHEFFKSHRK